METEIDLKLFGFPIDDDTLLSSRKARQSSTDTKVLDLKLFGFFIKVDKPSANPNNHQLLPSSSESKSTPTTSSPRGASPPAAPQDQPEDLPITHRHFFVEIGADGSTVQLIATRTLTPTDMNPHHSRLSMPHNQVKAVFLRQDEDARIGTGYKIGNRDFRCQLPVTVVDPSRRFYSMNLTKWNFNAEKKKSWWYALQNDWNELAAHNCLLAGDTIQIWSFRFLSNGDLGLLIRKIE